MRIGAMGPLTSGATVGTVGGEVSIESRLPSAGEVGSQHSVFETAMASAIEDASSRAQVAQEKVQALAAGTSDDLHGTLISTKEAEISLRLVNSVRTKLVDAFHELWRTNV